MCIFFLFLFCEKSFRQIDKQTNKRTIKRTNEIDMKHEFFKSKARLKVSRNRILFNRDRN